MHHAILRAVVRIGHLRETALGIVEEHSAVVEVARNGFALERGGNEARSEVGCFDVSGHDVILQNGTHHRLVGRQRNGVEGLVGGSEHSEWARAGEGFDESRRGERRGECGEVGVVGDYGHDRGREGRRRGRAAAVIVAVNDAVEVGEEANEGADHQRKSETLDEREGALTVIICITEEVVALLPGGHL